MRFFYRPPSDGGLYSSGKNLLADLEAWRLEHPEGALASQGRSGYIAGMAKARSRGAREVSWRGEIRVGDGGEATGQSSLRLRAPPSSSGDASCRTKGARLPPCPGGHLVAHSATIVQHLHVTPCATDPRCVLLHEH